MTDGPQQADLVVVNTVSATAPNVGDVITYTVTVTNNCPQQATNVSLQDVLPSGLSFLSTTGAGNIRQCGRDLVRGDDQLQFDADVEDRGVGDEPGGTTSDGIREPLRPVRPATW